MANDDGFVRYGARTYTEVRFHRGCTWLCDAEQTAGSKGCGRDSESICATPQTSAVSRSEAENKAMLQKSSWTASPP